MKCLRPRQPQHVGSPFSSFSVDWTCEQNGNVQTVKSVNDSRPGAEQTEAEGTGERDIDGEKEREEFALEFFHFIDSCQ